MNLARRRATTLSSTSQVERLPSSYPVDGSPRELSVVGALCQQLSLWGVEEAFGVSGGAIALLFDALVDSPIHTRHFRHETGAAFAACEGHFASGKPTVVFATTGPGLLNTLTGITAARWEGAKVILISGHTSTAQRGRWATQETSSYTLPQDALYTKGPIFDFAVRVESLSEMPTVFQRLGAGLARPGCFIAHLCLPMSVQSGHVQLAPQVSLPFGSAPAVSDRQITEIASLLRREGFVIWTGFGATKSAPLVRELVERSGVKIFTSPRGKGIVSERHPSYLGVTGIGGHDAVSDYMLQEKPRWTLVLGTRLSEATSFWDRDLLPSQGLIHVDLDPEVPGCAFPDFPTHAVQAEIGSFLESLLEHFPARSKRSKGSNVVPFEDALPKRTSDRGPVRPQALLETIQRLVIDQSDATVFSECGNAFAWCTHYLRFDQPSRYRVSTLFGSMGHTAAGVVGAALASGKKCLAVVGDGSMLMNSEVSTAAQYGARAVWVVLNDSGYGMCRDGHRALGVSDNETTFPQVDFVDWARSMGADGVRVETEDMLDVAIEEAMRASGPFMVDVRIDTREASPLLKRFESLISQGGSKNVAGWAQ